MEIESPSEKSFGIVFSIVFVLIALYPLLDGGAPYHWAAVVAFFLLITAYSAPRLLAPANRLWFKFGMMLGAVVAPIVMGIIYFTTVVPIGLFMRLLGKDLLHQKIDLEAKSYWIDRKQPVGSMEDQF